MTYYQVLGIGTAASDERVRAAYSTRLEMLHDDAHDAPTAAERRDALVALLRLHEAYRSLSDPARRRAYDGWLALDVATPLQVAMPNGPRGRCPVCSRVVRLVDAAPQQALPTTISQAIASQGLGNEPRIEVLEITPGAPDDDVAA